MDKEALRREIARATRLVDSRPSWKRDILARSSQPTLNEPRTPVVALNLQNSGEERISVQKEIPYAEETLYTGRNGHGKQTGLEVLDAPTWPIELRPINSKGDRVEGCVIRIPRCNLKVVVEALASLAEES